MSDTSNTDTETDISDVEEPDDQVDDTEPESPVDSRHPQQEILSSSSIARDVIANRGQYGRFAANWFSKGWGFGRSSTSSQVSSGPDTKSTTAGSTVDREADQGATPPAVKEDVQEENTTAEREQISADSSIAEALPKILRRTKMILTSGSFFFSYEIDLTRRLALLDGTAKNPTRETLDPLVS